MVFSRYDRYWERLSVLERQFVLNDEGLYSLLIQEVADQIVPMLPGPVVVDACCGVGGMTVALTRHGKKAIAVDLNYSSLLMCRVNVAAVSSGITPTFICGDVSELIPAMCAWPVFIDPGWGGPAYIERRRMSLTDLSPNPSSVFSVCRERRQFVAVRLPRNFDFSGFEPSAWDIQPNYYRGELIHYVAYGDFRVK